MATRLGDPFKQIKIDCKSVQQGAQKGLSWVLASNRRFGRAWGPLACLLDGSEDRVLWMPAHCTAENLEGKCLSDGTQLAAHDVLANACVDEGAKRAATKAAASALPHSESSSDGE